MSNINMLLNGRNISSSSSGVSGLSHEDKNYAQRKGERKGEVLGFRAQNVFLSGNFYHKSKRGCPTAQCT